MCTHLDFTRLQAKELFRKYFEVAKTCNQYMEFNFY
jgi:hypothetical protein